MSGQKTRRAPKSLHKRFGWFAASASFSPVRLYFFIVGELFISEMKFDEIALGQISSLYIVRLYLYIFDRISETTGPIVLWLRSKIVSKID